MLDQGYHIHEGLLSLLVHIPQGGTGEPDLLAVKVGRCQQVFGHVMGAVKDEISFLDFDSLPRIIHLRPSFGAEKPDTMGDQFHRALWQGSEVFHQYQIVTVADANSSLSAPRTE